MQMEEENICRLVQLPIGANARCRLFNFLIFGHRTETRKVADPIPLELSYATYPRAVTHGAKVRQASYGDVLRRARRMCHGITIRRDIS